MAADYTDIGLNNFLQPIDAPVTVVNAGTVSAYDFTSVNQRGIVSNMMLGSISADNIKAGTMTFERSSGGTLTLGGTANGNGVLNVNDAAGTNILV